MTRFRPSVETLESRDCPSGTPGIYLANGTLDIIAGDGAPQNIVVTQPDPATIQVDYNGAISTYAAGQVNYVILDGITPLTPQHGTIQQQEYLENLTAIPCTILGSQGNNFYESLGTQNFISMDNGSGPTGGGTDVSITPAGVNTIVVGNIPTQVGVFGNTTNLVIADPTTTIIGNVANYQLIDPPPQVPGVVTPVNWLAVAGVVQTTGDPVFPSVTFGSLTGNDFLVSFELYAGQTAGQGSMSVTLNLANTGLDASSVINATWQNLSALQNSGPAGLPLGDIQVSITATSAATPTPFTLDLAPGQTPPNSPSVGGIADLTGAQTITITISYNQTTTLIGNPYTYAPQLFTLDFHN